jgi:hypothetical protein
MKISTRTLVIVESIFGVLIVLSLLRHWVNHQAVQRALRWCFREESKAVITALSGREPSTKDIVEIAAAVSLLLFVGSMFFLILDLLTEDKPPSQLAWYERLHLSDRSFMMIEGLAVGLAATYTLWVLTGNWAALVPLGAVGVFIGSWYGGREIFANHLNPDLMPDEEDEFM